jgi:hypothetical protein
MLTLSDLVPSSDLTPGTWYISVVCSCRERVILFRDLTNGRGTLQGTFGLKCPACGKEGSFPAEHYQHNPRRSNIGKSDAAEAAKT